MPDRAMLLTAALALAPACVTVDSCFIGSTRIATPRGPRRIDELSVGDTVWAWSTDRGEPVACKVTAVATSVVERLWRVEAGELIVAGVTEQHPFFDPDAKQWRPVRKLALGAPLLGWLGGGEARRLPITALSERAERAVVYDLTVEGEHDFFAEGLLVHNKLLLPEPYECTGCDTGAEDLELLPAVLARCETAELAVRGVHRDVITARIVGPSTVTVDGLDRVDEEARFTVTADAASAEGLNDVVLDWVDGTSHVFDDHLLVEGDACE